MHDLSALMQNILRGIETREQARGKADDSSAADARRCQLIARLRALPAVPSAWQALVHERIRLAVDRWAWGDGNLLLLGALDDHLTIHSAG